MQKIQRFTTRQSMREKQFEIFQYRDRKMKNVGVHHHDFYEVYFFLGGKVNFRVQGRFYTLEPGDLLLINPHELHEAQVDPEERYERIVLWIDRGFLRELGGSGCDLTACFDRTDPGCTNLLRPDPMQRAVVQNILEQMTEEYYGNRFGSEVCARGLLIQFLVEINRMVQKLSENVTQHEAPDIVSQVLSYIGTHYQEPITLQSLADSFYISRYYLSHEFSRRVGTSVYRYIIFKRLMYAKEMMDDGVSPGNVYQVCGFGDYANFYRAFKNEYGISPKAYFQTGCAE